MLPGLILLAVTSALCCDVKPVQKLVVVAVSSAQIHVSWTTPSATDLECVQGYKICSAQQGKAPNCASVQNKHLGNYVITALLACEEYNVSVVTLGKDNSESQATVLVASTAPGPAASLTVVREANRRLNASWRYTSPAGGCAEQFKLKWCGGEGATAGCSASTMAVTAATAYSLQLPREQYCGKYTVSVVVLDKKPQSSDAVETTIEKYPIGGPENLTVTNYTVSSVEVRWDIPARQLNCEYHVFVVVMFTDNSTRKSVQSTLSSGRTSYAMTSIPPCKAYNITVGFGTATENRNASTVAYTLPSDFSGSGIFSNVSITQETSSSVNAAWTTLPKRYECITSYSVCWGQDNSTGQCGDTTSDIFNITGLESNTNYEVLVTARLGNGFPLESRKLTAATTSGAAGTSSNSIVRLFVILSLLEYIIQY